MILHCRGICYRRKNKLTPWVLNYCIVDIVKVHLNILIFYREMAQDLCTYADKFRHKPPNYLSMVAWNDSSMASCVSYSQKHAALGVSNIPHNWTCILHNQRICTPWCVSWDSKLHNLAVISQISTQNTHYSLCWVSLENSVWISYLPVPNCAQEGDMGICKRYVGGWCTGLCPSYGGLVSLGIPLLP